MAIFVTTGTMGAGKTAYVVDEICYNPLYKDRKVYHNINELDRELSEVWTKQDFQNWYVDFKAKYGTEQEHELEKNIIIVIDETQFVFPNRSATSTPPEYIAMLDVHRHFGIDFFLITQDLKKCDPVLRGESVKEHVHIWDSGVLSMFGIVNKTIYKGARANPSAAIRSAVSTKWYKPPKRAMRRYKSAAMHTKSTNTTHPVMYILLLGFLIVGYFLYNTYFGSKPQKTTTTAAVAQSTGGVNYGEQQQAAQSEARPFSADDLKPVDPSYPQSMPIYDGARPLKAMRRIAACVESKRGCNCYDAEGVKISYVPLDTCKAVLNQEYYSPYLIEANASGGSQAPSNSPQPQPQSTQPVQQQPQPQTQATAPQVTAPQAPQTAPVQQEIPTQPPRIVKKPIESI